MLDNPKEIPFPTQKPNVATQYYYVYAQETDLVMSGEIALHTWSAHVPFIYFMASLYYKFKRY